MLLPLTTERLRLRALVPADAPVLVSYRNDPEVARYQDWDLPLTEPEALSFVASQTGATTVLPDSFVQMGIEYEGELAGDVVVHLDHSGGLASIGYSLRRDRQRRGIAREAVAALVDALFERLGVHRVSAGIDPRNSASARLLEQLGFRYEGRMLAAVPVRGQWKDDDRYALLRTDREDWLSRPVGYPEKVELVEITPDTVDAVAGLATHHSQERFVATMAKSLRDALVPPTVDGVPLTPWLRAVLADGEAAAFVMLAEPNATVAEPHLWRLLVDRRHQRRGIGSRAIELAARHLREQGHSVFKTSYVPGRGGPEPFYRRLGFVPTGEVDEGEIVAVLRL